MGIEVLLEVGIRPHLLVPARYKPLVDFVLDVIPRLSSGPPRRRRALPDLLDRLGRSPVHSLLHPSIRFKTAGRSPSVASKLEARPQLGFRGREEPRGNKGEGPSSIRRRVPRRRCKSRMMFWT
ncbi:hypothetical protein BHM03_00001564 [Ensete ventricosum]|nr:hypothetical protein BHM03_00001564 [Ensete ventricosum]